MEVSCFIISAQKAGACLIYSELNKRYFIKNQAIKLPAFKCSGESIKEVVGNIFSPELYAGEKKLAKSRCLYAYQSDLLSLKKNDPKVLLVAVKGCAESGYSPFWYAHKKRPLVKTSKIVSLVYVKCLLKKVFKLTVSDKMRNHVKKYGEVFNSSSDILSVTMGGLHHKIELFYKEAGSL